MHNVEVDNDLRWRSFYKLAKRQIEGLSSSASFAAEVEDIESKKRYVNMMEGAEMMLSLVKEHLDGQN